MRCSTMVRLYQERRHSSLALGNNPHIVCDHIWVQCHGFELTRRRNRHRVQSRNDSVLQRCHPCGAHFHSDILCGRDHSFGKNTSSGFSFQDLKIAPDLKGLFCIEQQGALFIAPDYYMDSSRDSDYLPMASLTHSLPWETTSRLLHERSERRSGLILLIANNGQSHVWRRQRLTSR